MKEWIYLSLSYTPLKDDMEKLNMLSEKLENIGISFKVVDIGEGKAYPSLKIEYDIIEYEQKMKRGAGAPRKVLKKSVKVDEIRERMKTESAENIAKELGISRATLFRKLKQADEWYDNYIC